MEGDGDLDLVTLGGYVRDEMEGKIDWHENNGLGVFGPRRTIAKSDLLPHEGRESEWFVSDFDSDGDADILVAETSEPNNSLIGFRLFLTRLVGDTNDDGVFDSSDLVKVFQAGKYEDDVSENASFDEGDWNGDGEFDSSDLVFAFQAGTFVAAAKLANAAAAIDFLFLADDMTFFPFRSSL